MRNILILMLFLCTGWLNAQTISVQGRVFDKSDNSPLTGVNVLIKGTTIGTISDINGNYLLETQMGQTLVFSFVGMKIQEVVVNAARLDVYMESSDFNLDQIVVIGYGTQKKSDLTGSVGVANMNDVSRIATNDVSKALQGQIAGVSVQGSGEPGSTPQIKIRGINTFGDNAPLYVVDGIITPINDLPMSSIESMQVLKDGSAAAIYGARAANGVVIITTKRGTAGDLKISYNGYTGVQNITKKLDVANRQQYQLLVNEASVNAGVAIMPANDPSNPLYVGNVDTDWQDAVFKSGKIQEHSLSFSGGSPNSTYFVSLNYFDQTGTVVGKGPNYTRYAITVNSDHKRGKFKVGESISFTAAEQDLMSFVHDGTLMGYTVGAIPTIPVYDSGTIDGYGASDKTVDGSYAANVVGFNNMIDTNSKRFRFLGNIYGEYEILQGLKYKLSLSYERTDYRDFHFKPVHDLGWFYVNNIAKMNLNHGYGHTKTLEQTINFDREIGRSKINALIGNTVLDASVYNLRATAQGFSEPYFKQISKGTDKDATSDEFGNRMLSYFGRIIYEYDNKYMLQATLRRDGSSRFSQVYRWGTFPSIAIAYKLHNEEFMKSLEFLSQVKIRASYGELGNQLIPNYMYEAYINSYTHGVFSNQLALGATQTSFGTPDIRWETKKSTNIGIDLGFLNNQFSLTAEYFISKIDDLLLQVPIPEVTSMYPWENPWINGGGMENTGFEFTIGARKSFGEFDLAFDGNLGTLKNKVTSLGYGNNPMYGSISKTQVGGQVGQIYGYKVEKIFQTQAEIDQVNANSPIGRYQEALTSPGDIKFMDLNGDKFINDEDRTFLGSAIPKFTYGMSLRATYKNFDFTTIATGVSGNKVYNAIRVGLESGAGWDNYSTVLLDRWTPSNTNTSVPRVVMYDPNKNNRISDRWIEDGSYLRIANVELGYSLPSALLKRAYIEGMRVYCSVQNLYTFSDYSGFDPDFKNDGMLNRAVDNGGGPNRAFTDYSAGSLPNPRTFMVGVKLDF